MTFVGKLLVVITTGLSIVFLMWAIAVNQEQIDWFAGKAPAAGEQGGVIDELQAKVKDLNEGNKQAATRWAQNYYEVARREQDRPVRRDFYRQALQAVVTGDVPAVKGGPPVRKLTYDANGLVEPKFSNQPEEARPGVALDYLQAYERKIKDTVKEIQGHQETIAKLIEEHKELTVEIFGTPEKKGLRTLLTEQEGIFKDAQSELTFILPFWVNRYAENETLLKRISSMEGRVRELEKYEDARSPGR